MFHLCVPFTMKRGADGSYNAGILIEKCGLFEDKVILNSPP